MVTIENNKLIAEFMGARFISDGMNAPDSKDIFIPFHGSCRIDTIEQGKGKILKYHSSWDWIMPVVEKCLTALDHNDDIYVKIHDALWSINISEVYTACVEFIKWYNLNK